METFTSFAGPKWQLTDSLAEVPDKIRANLFAAMPELATGEPVRAIAYADQMGMRGDHYFVLTARKLSVRTGTKPRVLLLSEIADISREPRSITLLGPDGDLGVFGATAKPSKELVERLADLLCDAYAQARDGAIAPVGSPPPAVLVEPDFDVASGGAKKSKQGSAWVGLLVICIGIGTCWALSGDTPIVAPGGIYRLHKDGVAVLVRPGVPATEAELTARLVTVLSKGAVVQVSQNDDSWFLVDVLRSAEDRTPIAHGWVQGSLLVGFVDEIAKPLGW